MNQPTVEALAAAVGKEAGDELDGALRKIKHCVNQLDDAQLWWRQSDDMNSIANLILHLCGNVRQWIIAGVGGTEDARNRPQEFAERGTLSKAALIDRIESTVTEAKAVLSAATATELLQPRRIQGFEVTGLQAIFESVAHFRGHSQEIVHLTRLQLKDDYEFDFVPTSPEQGAPDSPP